MKAQLRISWRSSSRTRRGLSFRSSSVHINMLRAGRCVVAAIVASAVGAGGSARFHTQERTVTIAGCAVDSATGAPIGPVEVWADSAKNMSELMYEFSRQALPDTAGFFL